MAVCAVSVTHTHGLIELSGAHAADGAGRLHAVTPPAAFTDARTRLLRRGFALEYVTLGWNVIGVVVLAVTAISARSVALAGFGLDSLIEIGASLSVRLLWDMGRMSSFDT